MKILYLSNYQLENDNGVTQKMKMQMRHWVNQNHEVLYLSLNTLALYMSDGTKVIEDTLIHKTGKLNILRSLFLGSFKLKKVLKNIEFDVVYVRYKLYDPFFINALKGMPLVVEMNSNDIAEFKLRSKFGYYYNLLSRNRFLNQANGFVCVSNEIQRQTLRDGDDYIVIANGIDVSSFPKRKLSLNKNRLSLVFIGTPGSPWHGLDKIIYMSAKLSEFDFHIIGEKGQDSENLFFHGYLDFESTVEIIQKCDVGISTMALHRKEMNEASPLKSRQYLAMGIPIIYAYDDTDMNNEYSFALKLPNTESNVRNNIDLIRSFVINVSQNEKVSTLIRAFVAEHLDYKAKEENRLLYMERICLMHLDK